MKNIDKFEYAKTLKMSLVKNGKIKTVTPIHVTKIVRMFEEGKFDKQQLKYLADSKAQPKGKKLKKENYFNTFLMHMVKNGPVKTKDLNHGWVTDTWKISGFMHADIDINQDEWSLNLFNDIWDRLKTTKPLFMYRSPNGGIKCFWVTDLENNDFNKEYFARITQLKIRKICARLGILRFYDEAPTDPARTSYLSGTKSDGKDYFYSDFNTYEILETKSAVSAMMTYRNKTKELMSKRDLILNQSSIDSGRTGYDDLTENKKNSILIDCDTALSNALKKSKNSGGMTAWSLIGSLTGFGLDYNNTLAYLYKFHTARNKPASWNPKDKLAEYYSDYPERNQAGGFRKNSNSDQQKNKCKEIYDRLAKVEARLKEHTRNDHNAPFSFSKKYASKENPPIVTVSIPDDIEKTKKSKSKLNLDDLSSKNITAYTGLPGNGKSWKLLGNAAYDLHMNRVIIYVVPDTASMSSGIKGSRYNDLRDRIRTDIRIVKDRKKKLEQRICTVFYDSEDKSKQPVSQQFSNIIDNRPRNEGRVIFITTEALKIVDLSSIPNNSVLMIDDSNESPVTNLIGSWQKSEVDELKKYIVFDGKGDCLKVISASKEGIEYLIRNKNKGDKHPKYHRIEEAQKTVGNNIDQYYVINECKKGYSVYRAEVLSSKILDKFIDVYFAGDEIEYNPYLIIWKNAGAKIKYVDLPCRYKDIGSRLTIYYATEHGYSKTKMKTHQSIPIKIASVVSGKFVAAHKYALICMNKDQKDQVRALESGLTEAFDITTNSPNTKGKNNLKRNTLIINTFKCGLANDKKSVLSRITGITTDEIDTFQHQNLLMQNLFRGILRDRDSTDRCDYIAPCKKDAEYLQGRLDQNGFRVEIKLLDKELSDMFMPSKRGVIAKSGVAMSSSERKQLFVLRQKYGEDVDSFDPRFLLPKMKGLRSPKADEKFRLLKIELSTKVVSFQNMKDKMSNSKRYDHDITEVMLSQKAG